jgi:hypothetical protein
MLFQSPYSAAVLFQFSEHFGNIREFRLHTFGMILHFTELKQLPALIISRNIPPVRGDVAS